MDYRTYRQQQYDKLADVLGTVWTWMPCIRSWASDAKRKMGCQRTRQDPKTDMQLEQVLGMPYKETRQDFEIIQ